MSNSEGEKMARDYHLGEMTLRRNREWTVFSWSITLLAMLLAATLLAFRSLALGIAEAGGLVVMFLLIAVFAHDQMAHDRSVSLAHWEAVKKLHHGIPELASFTDKHAKLLSRMRYQIFLWIFFSFVTAVTLLLGFGIVPPRS